LYVALAALSSLKLSKEVILKVLEVIKLENLPLFDGIREEWETRARVDVLIDLLEVKFGMVPEDLRSQLSKIKDSGTIKETMRKVVNAGTIDEFTRMLKN